MDPISIACHAPTHNAGAHTPGAPSSFLYAHLHTPPTKGHACVRAHACMQAHIERTGAWKRHTRHTCRFSEKVLNSKTLGPSAPREPGLHNLGDPSQGNATGPNFFGESHGRMAITRPVSSFNMSYWNHHSSKVRSGIQEILPRVHNLARDISWPQ